MKSEEMKSEIQQFTTQVKAGTEEMPHLVFGIYQDEVLIAAAIQNPDTLGLVGTLKGVLEDLRYACSVDAFAMGADSYGTKSPINPETGMEWQRGEMSLAFSEGRTDIVSEQLTVVIQRINGETEHSTNPYDTNGVYEGWTEFTSSEYHPQRSGMQQDLMYEAFKVPTLHARIAEDPQMSALLGMVVETTGSTEEESMCHSQIAGFDFLSKKWDGKGVRFLTAKAEPNTVRADVYRKSKFSSIVGVRGDL